MSDSRPRPARAAVLHDNNNVTGVLTFHVPRELQTKVCLHGVLQKGLEPRHGVVMPPREGACRLSATSKLRARAGWEVRGRELGELPGHPGPDGVARRRRRRKKAPGALGGAWQTDPRTYQW